MTPLTRLAARLLTTVAAGFALAAPAHADGLVGFTFPTGFPVINDASTGLPLIGFGAAGTVTRTPVILVHGNNDTPFATPATRTATCTSWRRTWPTAAMP